MIRRGRPAPRPATSGCCDGPRPWGGCCDCDLGRSGVDVSSGMGDSFAPLMVEAIPKSDVLFSRPVTFANDVVHDAPISSLLLHKQFGSHTATNNIQYATAPSMTTPQSWTRLIVTHTFIRTHGSCVLCCCGWLGDSMLKQNFEKTTKKTSARRARSTQQRRVYCSEGG